MAINMQPLCDLYATRLKAKLESSQQMPKFRKNEIYHIFSMLEQIPTFDNKEKANRWLGFVHGYLWTTGIYTIDDLRAHVRMHKK